MCKSVADKYLEELDEIQSRTNFNFNDMNFNDKLNMIDICKSILQILDNYYDSEYLAIKSWANLDIDAIRLDEKELDYSKLNKMFSYIN